MQVAYEIILPLPYRKIKIFLNILIFSSEKKTILYSKNARILVEKKIKNAKNLQVKKLGKKQGEAEEKFEKSIE